MSDTPDAFEMVLTGEIEVPVELRGRLVKLGFQTRADAFIEGEVIRFGDVVSFRIPEGLLLEGTPVATKNLSELKFVSRGVRTAKEVSPYPSRSNGPNEPLLGGKSNEPWPSPPGLK